MSDTDDNRTDLPATHAGQAEDIPPSEEATAAEQEPVSTSATEPSATPRRRGSVLAVLLSLLALALAGGGIGAGYWAWLQLHGRQVADHSTSAQLAAQLQTMQARLAAQATQESVSALRSEVSALQQQVQTQSQTLNTLNKALEQSRALAQRGPRGWRLAEVEYLMRIARYRLDLMYDYAGSIAALQAADQELANLADPNLLPVRQALASEIAALQDFKKPDRVGIMLQLTQLANHLDGLAPTQPALGGKSVETAAKKPASGTWRGLLDKVWTVISEHIVVRHYDQPVEGAPAAETLLYTNQVLRLRLESARIAVMRANNADYHNEIKAALDWLNAHYAPQSAVRLRQQLQALLTHDIAPTPPDIGGSLTLLRKLSGSATREGSAP